MFPAIGNGPTESRTDGWPLTDIESPHESDILCGRGGAAIHTVSNRRYREMVNKHKSAYQKHARHKKTLMAEALVRKWKAENPPGRFLDKCDITGLYFDIGFKAARRKTSQLLREKMSPEDTPIEGAERTMDDITISSSCILDSSQALSETNRVYLDDANHSQPPAVSEAEKIPPDSSTDHVCDVQDLGASIGSFGSLLGPGDLEELQEIGQWSFSESTEKAQMWGSQYRPKHVSEKNQNATGFASCDYARVRSGDTVAFEMECDGNDDFEPLPSETDSQVKGPHMDNESKLESNGLQDLDASNVEMRTSCSEIHVCPI